MNGIIVLIIGFGAGWACSAAYAYFDKQSQGKLDEEVKAEAEKVESEVKKV